MAAATEALRRGDTVAVFPEGTTWCGSAAGRFRPAAFQAALDAGVPVVPVALRLCDAAGHPWPGASFVGAETLLSSLRRMVVWAAADFPFSVAAGAGPDPGGAGAERDDGVLDVPARFETTLRGCDHAPAEYALLNACRA